VSPRKPLLGAEALAAKGWWGMHRFLVLRRLTQLAVLLLFLSGPWWGVWIAKGNLASSLTLGVLPLTDPFLLLQSLSAGHAVAGTALLGAAIAAAFYLLVGGRVYCAWVCPMNVVTDGASWLRRRLNVRSSARVSRHWRWALLGVAVASAAATGTLAWELVNPVTALQRALIFGFTATGAFGLGLVVAVFLFDLFVLPRGWCGHLCPMGATYALLNRFALTRVVARRREACNDCADCYAVCPEPLILKPALKGTGTRVIDSAHCTNCARCIDLCSKDVFAFGTRFGGRAPGAPAATRTNPAERTSP
jgi:ferredoxin-type protein NapH